MGKFIKIFDYLSLALNLFFIIQILKVWIAPGSGDGGMVATIIFMFLFEFVMVHSGLVMSATGSSAGRLVIALFYIPFVLLFNYLCPSNIVLYAYLIAVLNRLRFAFVKPTKRMEENALYYTIGRAMLWMLTMTFVGIVNNVFGVPEFGLSEHYLNTTLIEERSLLEYLGGFAKQPQIFFCGAIIFYTVLTFEELKELINSSSG